MPPCLLHFACLDLYLYGIRERTILLWRHFDISANQPLRLSSRMIRLYTYFAQGGVSLSFALVYWIISNYTSAPNLDLCSKNYILLERHNYGNDWLWTTSTSVCEISSRTGELPVGTLNFPFRFIKRINCLVSSNVCQLYHLLISSIKSFIAVITYNYWLQPCLIRSDQQINSFTTSFLFKGLNNEKSETIGIAVVLSAIFSQQVSVWDISVSPGLKTGGG